MAQYRSVAAGEDRGQPRALARNDRVPHREDTAMERVEPAEREATVDRVLTDSERRDLSARDDAVLARRQRRDRRVVGSR
jgi:hypothetical protein